MDNRQKLIASDLLSIKAVFLRPDVLRALFTAITA